MHSSLSTFKRSTKKNDLTVEPVLTKVDLTHLPHSECEILSYAPMPISSKEEIFQREMFKQMQKFNDEKTAKDETNYKNKPIGPPPNTPDTSNTPDFAGGRVCICGMVPHQKKKEQKRKCCFCLPSKLELDSSTLMSSSFCEDGEDEEKKM